MFPGFESLVPQVQGELERLATQGAAELAGALFNGSAFVPYGPGQQPPERQEVQVPQHGWYTPQQQGGVHGQDAQEKQTALAQGGPKQEAPSHGWQGQASQAQEAEKVQQLERSGRSM
jgi:hypothetical protein